LSSRDLTKNEIWPQHIYLSHPSEKGEDSVTFLRAPPFFFPHLSIQALTSTLSHFVKKTLAQRELHPMLPTSKRKLLQHLRIPFRRNVIIFQHGFSQIPNACHSKIFAITRSRVAVSYYCFTLQVDSLHESTDSEGAHISIQIKMSRM
jgi:hypothetical protein